MGYGASSTAHLIKAEPTTLTRIRAIAFTDGFVNPPGNLLQEVVIEGRDAGSSALANLAAATPLAFEPASPAVQEFLKNSCRDFVSSNAPAGDPVHPNRRGDGVMAASAGHTDHASTTHAATEHVFKFLQEGLDGTLAASN